MNGSPSILIARMFAVSAAAASTVALAQAPATTPPPASPPPAPTTPLHDPAGPPPHPQATPPAQQPTPQNPAGPMKRNVLLPPTDFGKLDPERLGYITPQAAANSAWMNENFKRCDTDSNSEVSRSEFMNCTHSR